MASKADSPTKTCTKDGCERALRARGLCASHYNQEHQPNRHAKKMVACAWCGVEVLKQSGGGRKHGQVCSLQCRTWIGQPWCPLPADHWARWYGRTSAWMPPKQKVAAPYKQVACATCGSSFDTYFTTRLHCSSSCKRAQAGPHRRGKWISKARRERLHQRDDWTCWICGVTCDTSADPFAGDRYPTLDHLLPRSLGGRDDDGNLKTACRACNVSRGATPLAA